MEAPISHLRTLLAFILSVLAVLPAQAARPLQLDPVEPIGPAACTTVPELQGSGNTSPCQGHRDAIAGCITGVTATGFFFQDLVGDGDPATSDGIYAYYAPSWTNPAGLKPGDRVSVSGTVTEYYGTTEFADRSADPLQVTLTGACIPPPKPATIYPYRDPHADPQQLYERFESMSVALSFDGWVVGPTRRYVSRYPAGDPEIAFVDYSSSIPDDTRVFERDYPGYQGIMYLNGGLGIGPTAGDLPDLDFGDRVSGSAITGVLSYQYGKFTLLVYDATTLLTEDDVDPPPEIPKLIPGSGAFDICYFNAENLFDNVNDGHGDWGDWAPGWPASGTAEGRAAYDAKLSRVAKVIATWLDGCALVGLEEVEGKQQVWNDLADRVATVNVPGDGPQRLWAGRYVESGDPRDISQGFLIRDDVELLGDSLVPVQGAPYTSWVADGQLDFVRVPAAGRFRFNAGTPNEAALWAYNVHFKSKNSSSSCSTDDCTDRREKEAADMRQILLHHLAAGEYAVAGGDLNDTHGSSPIAILDADPGPALLLTGLWYELPERTRYSYIYNGESEALDHIYVTNLPLGKQPWKRALYPTHVQADLPSAQQASDHDLLRVIFWLPAQERRLYLPVVL